MGGGILASEEADADRTGTLRYAARDVSGQVEKNFDKEQMDGAIRILQATVSNDCGGFVSSDGLFSFAQSF